MFESKIIRDNLIINELKGYSNISVFNNYTIVHNFISYTQNRDGYIEINNDFIPYINFYVVAFFYDVLTVQIDYPEKYKLQFSLNEDLIVDIIDNKKPLTFSNLIIKKFKYTLIKK